jgi:hypothetical protein
MRSKKMEHEITKQEFESYLENFGKHSEAKSLVYKKKFHRFPPKEVKQIVHGKDFDVYPGATEKGEFVIILTDGTTYLEKSGCCPPQ